MGEKLWMMLSILAVLIILIVIMIIVAATSKKKIKTDYYILFIMGLVWLVVGIPLGNNTLMALGLIFALAGIVNKDKWKKNMRQWKHLSKIEKKMHLAILVILTVLVIAGLVLIAYKKICYG